ncbi:rust resistance kinase Lr10-like isoform X2 [Rosa rugosa]|uniref:rust resistance kinase Lr10-like isoform X2 n=1 Tax=Rosa rugosa TaxID=74645 RepID=UPI002B407B70|nr:rust resistance kinase Lr10-like isoform X2 [Rosa rugosa]
MQHILIISSFCLLAMAFPNMLNATKNECKELKCRDDGPGIHFPFLLKDRHPHHCGYPGFVVSCNQRDETVLELPQIPFNFAVRSIDYRYQEIELYDPENCLQVKLIKIQNMSTPPFVLLYPMDITLFNCSSVIQDNSYMALSCLSSPGHQIYAVNSDFPIDHFLQSCTKMYNVLSVASVNQDYVVGNWSTPMCTECEARGKRCTLRNNSTICIDRPASKGRKTKLVATGATLGSFVLILFILAVHRIYRYDRDAKENRLKIESFLEDYKALKPSRYSYADIKRITNQFKDKLGEGAYGTVFKGMLSSEFFVAVKVLTSSKGNGEEFINEVATMGHIHHVNVVRLVGFCADGFRRALVYEFLPNGSLQDLLSSENNKNSILGRDKLHDIALGIAKGIEYLHQGCDQRILHFDIKPHNVLLDNNFTPKLSDFGLAKLCSKDQSLVSMTTARGTMGYIAPEVFSRNFGTVSYKADVYSFGMLLLEMIQQRRNIGATTTENTDDVYYPESIYNLQEGGESTEIHTDREGDIKTRLAIIGLWCIQWHPVDRPSMKVVLQMLEGGENLTMPPNPFRSTRDTTGVNATDRARKLNLQLERIVELE